MLSAYSQKTSNLVEDQELARSVGAVQHNFQPIKKGVESMENQVVIEVPILGLFVLLEVGRTLFPVCLSRKELVPRKI